MTFTVAVQVEDAWPSLTTRVTVQDALQHGVSRVRTGVGLVGLSKLAPGQLIDQLNVSASSVSGSLEPVPSSLTDVVGPPHGAV